MPIHLLRALAALVPVSDSGMVGVDVRIKDHRVHFWRSGRVEHAKAPVDGYRSVRIECMDLPATSVELVGIRPVILDHPV